MAYQWRINGVPVFNGQAAGGGQLAGATGPSLSIDHVGLADAGLYDCAVTGACGSVTSRAGALSVRCFADYDRNSFVNGDDYDLFVGLFEAGDPAADVDESGFVNGDDIDMFMDHFVAGC